MVHKLGMLQGSFSFVDNEVNIYHRSLGWQLVNVVRKYFFYKFRMQVVYATLFGDYQVRKIIDSKGLGLPLGFVLDLKICIKKGREYEQLSKKKQ